MNPGKSFLRHGKSKSLANEVLRGKARQDVTKIFTIKRERERNQTIVSHIVVRNKEVGRGIV